MIENLLLHGVFALEISGSEDERPAEIVKFCFLVGKVALEQLSDGVLREAVAGR